MNKKNILIITMYVIMILLTIIGASAIVFNPFTGPNVITDINQKGTYGLFNSTRITVIGIDSNNASRIDIYNTFGYDDGTGINNRAEINFWNDNSTISHNNRALSIQTHTNKTQKKHVTFYSNLINGSWDGKALEWYWGEDTNGFLYLPRLNKIKFPLNRGGYYDNENVEDNGIYNRGGKFYIDMNSDLLDLNIEWCVTYNNRTKNMICTTNTTTNISQRTLIQYSGYPYDILKVSGVNSGLGSLVGQSALVSFQGTGSGGILDLYRNNGTTNQPILKITEANTSASSSMIMFNNTGSNNDLRIVGRTNKQVTIKDGLINTTQIWMYNFTLMNSTGSPFCVRLNTTQNGLTVSSGAC